jgi:hypothetical protein
MPLAQFGNEGREHGMPQFLLYDTDYMLRRLQGRGAGLRHSWCRESVYPCAGPGDETAR